MMWRWVSKPAVLSIHHEQIAEHGGKAGLRDEGLLESALDRLRKLAAYENSSMADLAAAYAFGIARNHPFLDGNKRTAFVASVTFLLLNGFDIAADETEVVEIFLQLADGKLTNPQLYGWFDRVITKNQHE